MHDRHTWQRSAWQRAITLAPLVLVLSSCSDSGDAWDWGKPKPPPPKPELLAPRDPIRSETIGAVTALADAQPLMLKGFGLVVGLDGHGSSGAAESIRTYLVERLQRLAATADWQHRIGNISINALIASPDTAVVEVTALVPAGAPRGTRFDVRVMAAVGTQTTSLAGGLLLPTELKIFAPSGDLRGLLTSKTLGYASGPVFTDPYAQTSSTGPSARLREGLILGGGSVLDERPIRLVLRQSSYDLARRIEQRLNERFGPNPPTGEAATPNFVVMHTPRDYSRDFAAFVRVAPYVCLDNRPEFIAAKMRELVGLASAPQPDLTGLTFAWEAMGRVAVPYIQPLYASRDQSVSFHAARAGLLLDDPPAEEVIGAIATTAHHPWRLDAVRLLGQARSRTAGQKLLPLIDDPDPEVRIAAYEALLRQRHPAIAAHVLAHRWDEREINFSLDVLDTRGPPLIYVRRSRAPRIVLLGQRIPITRPLFYNAPSGRLVLNATAADSDIAVMVQIMPDRPAEKFTVPPQLDRLILLLGSRPDPDEQGRPRGAGLCYAEVIEVLLALSRDRVIPAPVVLERESLRELLGPGEGTRPESDEPSLEEYEASLRDHPAAPGAATGHPAINAPGRRPESDAPGTRPETDRPDAPPGSGRPETDAPADPRPGSDSTGPRPESSPPAPRAPASREAR